MERYGWCSCRGQHHTKAPAWPRALGDGPHGPLRLLAAQRSGAALHVSPVFVPRGGRFCWRGALVRKHLDSESFQILEEEVEEGTLHMWLSENSRCGRFHGDQSFLTNP